MALNLNFDKQTNTQEDDLEDGDLVEELVEDAEPEPPKKRSEWGWMFNVDRSALLGPDIDAATDIDEDEIFGGPGELDALVDVDDAIFGVGAPRPQPQRKPAARRVIRRRIIRREQPPQLGGIGGRY